MNGSAQTCRGNATTDAGAPVAVLHSSDSFAVVGEADAMRSIQSARRLKIAYLVTQYPKVSHSFIRREIQALERLGLDVIRISVRGWQEQLADPEDFLERGRTRYVLQAGLFALFLSSLRLGLTSPGRFLAALCLASRMAWRADRPLPFHLIYLAEACWMVPRLQLHGSRHLHAHFGTNSAEVAMLVHELCGIPYSFTAHGPDEFDMPQSIKLGEKIRRSAFAVAVSSFGRSQMVRWVGPEHWDKVKVVHCGLERAFHDVPAIPVPERPRLVCVGRLSGQKGQLLLVKAASVLASDGVEFELVLAGDGEMRATIEKEVIRHGLEAKVRITGWIGSEQVRNEIQAARALVLPSFAEGLPVVLMEAMALRRPVLTTYIAGIPELVIDGETGWLFPAGSLDALVAAMKACLEMPTAMLEAMGARARERVLLRHDVDREAARLAEFFQASVSAPGIAGSAR